MKKNYFFFIVLVFFACGRQEAISYKQYQQAHQRDREEHLRLVEEHSWLFDTLARQTLDHMEEKDERERVLESWEHTSTYFREMCISEQIYSHVIVLNDNTHESVMKMWAASHELSNINSTATYNVSFAIRFESKYNLAVGHLEGMRVDVRKSMKRMQEGASEYQKIVFPPKKES